MTNTSGHDAVRPSYVNLEQVYGTEIVFPAEVTPLPAGRYIISIDESCYVANEKGNGMIAEMHCRIIGGRYDGRPYCIDLTLEHENKQALDLGQLNFFFLRRAVGVLTPRNSAELHDKPFGVTIGVKPSKVTGEPVNFIREFHPAGGTAGPGSAPMPVSPLPAPVRAVARKAERRPSEAHPWRLSTEDLAGLVGRGAGHQHGLA